MKGRVTLLVEADSLELLEDYAAEAVALRTPYDTVAVLLSTRKIRSGFIGPSQQ